MEVAANAIVDRELPCFSMVFPSPYSVSQETGGTSCDGWLVVRGYQDEMGGVFLCLRGTTGCPLLLIVNFWFFFHPFSHLYEASPRKIIDFTNSANIAEHQLTNFIVFFCIDCRLICWSTVLQFPTTMVST